MSTLPCPLPEVEAALEPFIHSRQRTLAIRQNLTQHLQSQLVDNGAHPAHLQLVCPSPGTEVASIPAQVAGLRRKYFEALQANLAARRQHEALRNELDELQTSIVSAKAEIEAASEKTAVQEYISLLHQRQRHGRLQVIQRTSSQLLAAEPNPVKTEPKAMLNETLGEPPQPLAIGVTSDVETSDVETLIFKLKREVLTAKQGKDRSSALQTQAQGLAHAAPEPATEAEVHALSCARDELVTWIEDELAKISDGEGEAADVATSLHVDGGNVEDEDLRTRQQLDEIQELYSKYITARTSLIAKVNAVTAESPDPLPPSEKSLNPPASSPTKTSSQQRISTDEILPYIPGLLQVSRDERSLVQQSTYLRRKLANASAESARTIQRLAGESHLVTPSADSIAAWAAAAEASSARTETFVREQLRAGETHVVAAERTLAELRARKGAFGRLDGTL